MEKATHSIIKRIAFIGNYQPRQCGIATFTTDLSEAKADEYKGLCISALHLRTGVPAWRPQNITLKQVSFLRKIGVHNKKTELKTRSLGTKYFT